MKKLNTLLDKLLSTNFPNGLYKTTYLYNELFISIFSDGEFVLYGISYKANKLLINKYGGSGYKSGKILSVLFKKYENIFLKLLEKLNKNLFKIGNESEFINIYDNEKLGFQEVKSQLEFNFLDDYTYRRRSELDFKIENKSILEVYHSDYECSKCNGPVESFTNFPDYTKDLFDIKYYEDKKGETPHVCLNTNITDYESITIGGNEKINDILKQTELLNSFDLITVNKTCMSIIMGDDIQSIFKYNKIDPKKILYTDQNTDSGYRAIINFLKNLKIKKGTKQIDEIVFFGLNKNKNTYEVSQFLKNKFGITVGNALIPNIDEQELEEITKYKLGVFFTGREVKAQNIFKLYPINSMETNVPYGISNFKLLCSRLLHELIGDIPQGFDELFENKNQEYYSIAQKTGIGFIIHDFHVKQFLVDNFRGTTILSMLKDMGFKIHFFIHSNSDKNREDLDAFSQLGYDIVISDNNDKLHDFISHKDIQLYYSEISNDKRILKENKEQFSVGDLEYGIEGFYRSYGLLMKKIRKVHYCNSKLNHYLK